MLFMSALEIFGNFFQGYLLFLKKYQKVKQQVGGFIDEILFSFLEGRDNGFHGLFTYLLCNFINTHFMNFYYVRALHRIVVPFGIEPLKFKQKILDIFGLKAAS